MRDFMLGTLLGMGPGILLTVAFAHQLVASLRHPTVGSFAVLISIGVVLVGISLLLQRFLGRPKASEAEAEAQAASAEEKAKASDEAARAHDFLETNTPPRDEAASVATNGKRTDEVNS
jgi:hypothetical protein